MVTRSMTDVYGVGAFLLAGTEVWALADWVVTHRPWTQDRPLALLAST